MADFAALDRERLLHLKALGMNPGCFYDVGASNGRWSELVGMDFPEARFEMFEPLSDHAAIYREPMRKLLDSNPRFRLHKCAVGAETKAVTVHAFSDSVSSTTLPLKRPREGVEPVQVEMIRLDEALSRFGLQVPDVIKIDTQGGELNVLRGARGMLPHVGVIILEAWLTRGYGPQTPLLLEVADWLRECNFFLFDLGDTYRNGRGTLVTQDCVFLNSRCGFSPLKKEPLVRAPRRRSIWSRLLRRK